MVESGPHRRAIAEWPTAAGLDIQILDVVDIEFRRYGSNQGIRKFGASGNSVGSGHEIEASAVEVDRRNEVPGAAEAASSVLDPLNP